MSEQWARALVARIGVALRRQSVEVVHYRHRLDALADAVAGLALGRPDRAWAWAQVGVLAPGGPDPAAAPSAALLAVLLASPGEVVPALVTASRGCGMAALDRAVGASGWEQLARRLWGSAAGPVDGAGAGRQPRRLSPSRPRQACRPWSRPSRARPRRSPPGLVPAGAVDADRASAGPAPGPDPGRGARPALARGAGRLGAGRGDRPQPPRPVRGGAGRLGGAGGPRARPGPGPAGVRRPAAGPRPRRPRRRLRRPAHRPRAEPPRRPPAGPTVLPRIPDLRPARRAAPGPAAPGSPASDPRGTRPTRPADGHRCLPGHAGGARPPAAPAPSGRDPGPAAVATARRSATAAGSRQPSRPPGAGLHARPGGARRPAHRLGRAAVPPRHRGGGRPARPAAGRPRAGR